jgi:hypothetical protein
MEFSPSQSESVSSKSQGLGSVSVEWKTPIRPRSGAGILPHSPTGPALPEPDPTLRVTAVARRDTT